MRILLQAVLIERVGVKEANAVGYGDQEVNRKIWGAVNTWPAGDIFFFFYFSLSLLLLLLLLLVLSL